MQATATVPVSLAEAPQSRVILGSRVDSLDYPGALSLIRTWVRRGESRTIVASTVNNIMEGVDHPQFRVDSNSADLVTTDGTPLVWGLRLLGIEDARRVCGPDLLIAALGMAEREGLAVGFYGGSEAKLARLLAEVRARWPRLRIVYSCSPPFRELTGPEQASVVSGICAAGVQLLFVGLGCPKQETWVARHRGRIPCVMLAVGAAFDYLSGSRRAPRWMHPIGCEWLFRLIQEPRRLWRRYLIQNPRFLARFALQIIRYWRDPQGSEHFHAN